MSNNTMGRVLTFAGQWFTTCLLLAIGLISYGCKDSVSISEDVQVPLAGLTVTPGTLQPAFFSNTTNYTVDVSTTVTSVIVTATPKDSTTTMTINTTTINPGQGRSVPLSPSGTTTDITIVLTNQNGIQSTYDIVVRKVDNTLSALTVTPPGTFPPPGFSPSTLNYQVDVGSSVPSVTISATKLDPRAVMSGAVTAGAGVATGQAIITLNEPGLPTVVSITVAVPNSEAKVYTITVNRAKSDDNNLLALSITPPGTFPPPGFAPSILDYTVNVATNITSVDVTATKSDTNAVMAIGSVTVPAGTASGSALNIPLGGPGTDTLVTITVTAQNGDPKAYTITVNRAASSDDTLSVLTVTVNNVVQPLAPDFNASILGYTVNVVNTVDQVTVAATKADLNAVMQIGSVTVPAGTASGSAPNIPLGGPGTQTIVSISVTAQSGGAPKIYTITVNRAASSDDTLSALTVTANNVVQPLAPDFNASILGYTVNVANTIGQVTVVATKSDLNAVMLIGSVTVPAGTASGQETFPLNGPGTQTVVSIAVTAQSGGAPKTYTITIDQAP